MVSTPPHRPRSISTTRSPAFLRRYAAVIPVRPPPTTTASTIKFFDKAGNLGIRAEFVQSSDVFMAGRRPLALAVMQRRRLRLGDVDGFGFGGLGGRLRLRRPSRLEGPRSDFEAIPSGGHGNGSQFFEDVPRGPVVRDQPAALHVRQLFADEPFLCFPGSVAASPRHPLNAARPSHVLGAKGFEGP